MSKILMDFLYDFKCYAFPPFSLPCSLFVLCLIILPLGARVCVCECSVRRISVCWFSGVIQIISICLWRSVFCPFPIYPPPLSLPFSRLDPKAFEPLALQPRRDKEQSKERYHRHLPFTPAPRPLPWVSAIPLNVIFKAGRPGSTRFPSRDINWRGLGVALRPRPGNDPATCQRRGLKGAAADRAIKLIPVCGSSRPEPALAPIGIEERKQRGF